MRAKLTYPMFVVLLLAALQSHAATERPIVIVNPAGGEVYAPGSTQTILLDPKTRAKTILVEISRDGGVNFDPVGTIDNTQKAKALRNRLDWTPDLPASNEAILRATSTDPRKPGDGQSNLFSIADVLDSDPSGLFVLKAGDTMTGDLTLAGAPTQNLHAATKKYVDDSMAAIDTLENGGTITGDLTVDGNLTVTGTVTIPTTTRFYSVPHTAFQPRLIGVAGSPTATVTDSDVTFAIANPSIVYAPLNLPNGATITEFQITIDNQGGTTGLTALLFRTQLSDGTASNIQSLTDSSSVSAPQLLTGTALSHQADNSAFSYSIKVTGVSTNALKIHGARIKYTITAPLP